MFKKGTEKPIEIFVALFVILAVAMLMLNLFKDQITDKTTDLEKIDRETKLSQQKTDAQNVCKTKCSDAYSNDCSLRAKANFCLYKIEGGLDLDGDRSSNGVDNTLLGGINVCEDGIYCPMLQECNCGEKLDLATCAKVLCEYWDSQGIPNNNTDPDFTKRTELLNKSYAAGSCTLGEPTWWETNLKDFYIPSAADVDAHLNCSSD